MRYAYGAAPNGAYTILALWRRLALLPTAEPPELRRSVIVDISVASSQAQSSSASLHAPYYQGTQALRKRCPALRVGLKLGRQRASSRLRAATRGSQPVEICEAF
jgi:hypothetical protein